MASKISPAIWNGIVARVLSRKSTAREEGRRYSLPASTIRNRVMEARRKMGGKTRRKPDASPSPSPTPTEATQADAGRRPSENASPTPLPDAVAPTPATPADPPEDAYSRAQAAAGIPAPGASPTPTTTPTSSPASVDAAARQAEADDKRLVVETYHDAKKAAVELLARRVGIPPEDPLLSAATEVRPIVRTVLEANAGLIAPTIRGRLIGWPAVAGILVFDGVVTIMAIREVAVARGVVKQRGAPLPVVVDQTAAPPAAEAAAA